MTQPAHPAIRGRGLQSRLIKVFAIQATLVSIATILGVFAAYYVAENVLVKQALRGEANYYWSLHQRHQAHPLPNTHNMRAYLAHMDSSVSVATLPAALQKLEANFFGRVKFDAESPLVLVSELNKQRLYLIFKEEQISQLAIMFGVAPLSVVLILIYLASWLTFRQSQKVISPVTDLVNIVETSTIDDSFALEEQLRHLIGIDTDIDALVTALSHYSQRLQRFIDRERSFTRHASHELRTPLAVIKGCLDILSFQSTLSEQQRTVLNRMTKTIKQMESLIETLLLLAREDHQKLIETDINVAQVTRQAIDQVKEAFPECTNPIHLMVHADISIVAAEHVFLIVITNLIRNALQHGKGSVITIEISASSISIMDQGDGMDHETLQRVFRPFERGASDNAGHGLGLSIVQRLCEQCQWHVEAQSTPEVGTKMSVHFGARSVI